MFKKQTRLTPVTQSGALLMGGLNMSIYSNILVVADLDQDEQIALARGIHLAQKSKSQSHITFFAAIYDFSYDMTTMLSSHERESMRKSIIAQKEAWMRDISAPYLKDQSDIEIDIKVVWFYRPFESIIEQVFTGSHDIVIKSTHKHGTVQSVIFTPTDWHLMRKCPVPVLLVKAADWPDNANIIAAVNVGTEDETHMALNRKIVCETLSIAERFVATPYLVSSYPATPINISVELPEFDATSYSDALRGYHLTSMKTLRQEFGLPEEQTIVEQGPPEIIVPETSEKLDAAMVVIGTIGRTGLSAIFIGNTAENVIDNINCDVLAIKPVGYVSPFDPSLSE